jgi:FkbM family methyltransferase
MNSTLRRTIVSVPFLRALFYWMRSAYNDARTGRIAQKVFSDPRDYREALEHQQPGQLMHLRMLDDLDFTVRRNRRDAEVLAEVFLDCEYVSDFTPLGMHPIVVDVGGYIGDFAIYAAARLKAKKVITIEPSPQNFDLLTENIRNNGLSDKIVCIQKAMTNARSVRLSVKAPENAQWRVSAYYERDQAEMAEVQGISLDEIVRDYSLSNIDLLKLDCEGGEYDILLSTPREVLTKVQNVVLEFHEISGWQELLTAVKTRLLEEGFRLRVQGRGQNLIAATRSN